MCAFFPMFDFTHLVARKPFYTTILGAKDRGKRRGRCSRLYSLKCPWVLHGINGEVAVLAVPYLISAD